MLTDPKKRIKPDLEFCHCQRPKPFTHTNGKVYCEKCGFKIRPTAPTS